MRRQKIWRVRVKRTVEDWVDVTADTPLQAESQAANLPQVVFVFGQSAVRGDRPVNQVEDAGVLDDEDY